MTDDIDDRTPTLPGVIQAHLRAALEGVHTSIPGKVVKYDAAKQRADVAPLVRAPHLDETGRRVAVDLPVVVSVPVQFSGGGGMVITHPVAVGDVGLLVFAESSLDKWLAGDGRAVDPEVDIRFGLQDAAFIPGVRPFGKPRATAPTDHVAIGTDGGAYQGAALGGALAAYLATGDAFTTLLGWLAAHTHSSGGSGAPNIPPPTAPDVESNTVKITP